jgi:hypothetical protein
MMNREGSEEAAQQSAVLADPAADSNAAHLTQEEVAQRFRISVATIERWRSESIGPMYLKLCGKIRYRLQDILAYEQDCLRRGTGQRAADPG